MNDDFWAPVFARLHEDLDLLRLICADTHDTDLLNWIKPNPRLWSRCARFMQRKKIGNRSGLIEELLKCAEQDAALRKLIFFNWVEKNPKSMSLFSQNTAPEVFARLLDGEFGNSAKVAILQKIDPRQGVENFYQAYLSSKNEEDTTHQSSDLSVGKDSNIDVTAFLKEIETLRQELKESRNAYSQRAAEISGLQKALAERDLQLSKFQANALELEKQIQQLHFNAVTVSSSEPSELNNLRDSQNQLQIQARELSLQLDDCQERVESLTRQLQRKEAAVSSLAAQNSALKAAISNEEDKDKKISTLQALVQKLDQADTEFKLSGQLLCINDRKKQWFLTCFGGELISLGAEKIREAECCQAEFCSASFAGEDKLVAIESLELNKQIVTGYLIEKEEQIFLCDGENQFPIWCEVDGKDLSRPCRGIFLSSFQNRPAGIYELFFISSAEKRIVRQAGQPDKKEKPPETQTELLNFNGKKLLILGGDYVGHEYEKALQPHNLKVTWLSGFQNLGRYRHGLNEFDLVVIVLRQISHTLLRETVQAGHKHNIPLLYCKKRGTSGLLAELKAYFSV